MSIKDTDQFSAEFIGNLAIHSMQSLGKTELQNFVTQ